jgi:hypothetical protein
MVSGHSGSMLDHTTLGKHAQRGNSYGARSSVRQTMRTRISRQRATDADAMRLAATDGFVSHTLASSPVVFRSSRYKVCDELDVPSSYSKGAFRIDALGETLLVFRVPAVHPFGSQVKEGEVVVLVESSLNGVDPLKDLDACGPLANPLAKRWISQEINRMVFVWHHDANHQEVPAVVDDNSDRPASPTLSVAQPPQWPIPLIRGMENWNYHGRVTHEIACHIQEIPGQQMRGCIALVA